MAGFRVEKAMLTLAKNNLENALSGGGDDAILLQAAVFPRFIEMGQGQQTITNATGSGGKDKILLPYTNEDGSAIYLGDVSGGYPPQLYPNFTDGDQTSNGTYIIYEGKALYSNSTLVLGPLFLHDNSSLISMTVAINSK